MSPWVATINVPGYLPMDDDPPIFETPAGAWEYLADLRAESEDHAFVASDATYNDGYSETWEQLQAWWASCLPPWPADTDVEGTVYGPTPGYDGDHDLGLAYCVTYTDETEEV